MASIKRRPDGVWRARYRDDDGREHAKHFARKVDAQRWLDERTVSVARGHARRPEDGADDGRRVVRDVARRLRHAPAVDRAAGPRARRADRRRVWVAAAGRGPAVTGTGVVHEAGRAGLRDLHGLRAARPTEPDHERCRARRDRSAVAVLEADVAACGEAAALRCDDGAGVGAARRDARRAAPGDPARRVRRPAGRGGVRAADRRTST